MFNRLLIAALAITVAAHGQITLQSLPEHERPDPFGGVVKPDRTPNAKPRQPLVLRGARDGYVSSHVLVGSATPTTYTLTAEVGGLEVDLFREWFHYVPAEKTWYPDALVPTTSPVKAAIPDTDNKVPGQRTQAFWMDVWIPKTAKAEEPTKDELSHAAVLPKLRFPSVSKCWMLRFPPKTSSCRITTPMARRG